MFREKVLVTEELLQQGKSDKGGWTKKQFAILGIEWPPQRGWKYKVVDRLWLSASSAERFVALRPATQPTFSWEDTGSA